MNRKLVVVAVMVLVLLAAALPAFADAPNFGPAIYADGKAWGTKGLSDLPAPNGKNDHSFDILYRFTNGAPGQLAVAEASPGNPEFNGGRWNVMLATWTEAAISELSELPVLMSDEALLAYVAAGYITVVSGNEYFLCPLLPVK
jgi:hypothetical protein